MAPVHTSQCWYIETLCFVISGKSSWRSFLVSTKYPFYFLLSLILVSFLVIILDISLLLSLSLNSVSLFSVMSFLFRYLWTPLHREHVFRTFFIFWNGRFKTIIKIWMHLLRSEYIYLYGAHSIQFFIRHKIQM